MYWINNKKGVFMFKYLFFSILLLPNICIAGEGETKITRMTDMDYEECINKIYFKQDILYKEIGTVVLKREKDLLQIQNKNAIGTSTFVAKETRKINEEEGIFQVEMIRPLTGNLKDQSTTIVVKNIKGKAEITIEMKAALDSVFASRSRIETELEKNIEKVIKRLEKM
jgi:hypothetical protein